MNSSSGLARNARGLLAKLQNLRTGNAPYAPAIGLRDPWPGDPSQGARLVKGELVFAGAVMALGPGVFHIANATTMMRAHAHGFTWLRDLRALGTDAARSRARALVSEFLSTSALDPAGATGDAIGARICAWLGHYDFFAASADDEFRQALMGRLVADARSLSAALPLEVVDQRALVAIKGLIAASVAMPEHTPYLPRALKFLTAELGRQILKDGCHCERSPLTHLAALQDLTEMRALIQASGAEPPEALRAAVDKMAAAMRAMRHGDGALALFNGAKEDQGALIDLVLAQAGRARGSVAVLNEGKLIRMSAGKSLVIVDCGAPAGPGLERFAHAGTLAFEFSVGRERIIVNCGAASAQNGDWREALRSTAAHSTLTIADVSSAQFSETGPIRRPAEVTLARSDANGAQWTEASHDGWKKLFGATHHRRLCLQGNGDELLGEDLIEAAQPQPFTIRFHLHPNVTVSLQEDQEAVLIRTAGGQGFRLRSDAQIKIDESVYFGQAEPRRAEQIVLAGHQDGPQHIKWSIMRV